MLLSAFILLVTSVLGLCRDTNPSLTDLFTSPACTVTYAVSQPPQLPPTSTVYQQIVTSWLYAVNCDLCTFTNINTYSKPNGPYHERSTGSALTVTQIECMPTGRESTRRVMDIDENVAAATSALVAVQPKPELSRRAAADQLSSLAEKASHVGEDFDPDNSQMSQKNRRLLTQIRTAIFALTIAESRLNTTSACISLQSLDVRYELVLLDLDPDQAANIVCWADKYGINLNTTRSELSNVLEAAAYALQVASSYTTDRGRLCEVTATGKISTFGPPLGIDAAELIGSICEGTGYATASSRTGPGSLTTVGPPISWSGTSYPTGTGPWTTGRVDGGYGNWTGPLSTESSSSPPIPGTGYPTSSDAGPAADSAPSTTSNSTSASEATLTPDTDSASTDTAPISYTDTSSSSSDAESSAETALESSSSSSSESAISSVDASASATSTTSASTQSPTESLTSSPIVMARNKPDWSSPHFPTWTTKTRDTEDFQGY